MNNDPVQKTVLAGIGAFAAVLVVGSMITALWDGGTAPSAVPQAAPVSASSERLPVAASSASPLTASEPEPEPPASSASLPTASEPEPLPPAPAAFTFSAEELMQRLSEDLHWDFDYHGEFSQQGIYVAWMADHGQLIDTKKNVYLRVAAYAQSEGGPVEAIQLYGDIASFRVAGVTGNAKTLSWQFCLEDEAVGGEESYVSGDWNADEQLYTIWASGSALTREQVEQIPWSAASALADGSGLLGELQRMNQSYRYPELVELLTAAGPEAQRAKDPFLAEALALAQRGAQLEAQCAVDSTISADPVIYYQGVTEITDEINFVPRIAAGNIGALAGFYDVNNTPFTRVEVRSGQAYASDSCDSNDITQISINRFLKSNGNLLVSTSDFKNIAAMEAPVIRFIGKTQPKMKDHVFTDAEVQACRTLYELEQLKTELRNRSNHYGRML